VADQRRPSGLCEAFVAFARHNSAPALPLPSGRAPVVRLLFIVEMADAGNKGYVALLLRPFDGFSLHFECGEHVVCVVLNDVIIDMKVNMLLVGTNRTSMVVECTSITKSFFTGILFMLFARGHRSKMGRPTVESI
jgi:hypothetical protein